MNKLLKSQLNVLVKELADYKVVTGEGVDGTGEYLLVNKTYGVVEAATPMLPQCLEYLEQLQAGLDARNDMAKEVEAPPEDAKAIPKNVSKIH